VRPGDALRLMVTLDRRRLVRAWSIDDEGRIDALMSEPRALDPGATELDGSAVIDRLTARAGMGGGIALGRSF
jgi:hypothetical protein